MEDKVEKILHKSIYRLLLPLVRLNLHYRISVKDFFGIAKKAYVDIARQEYGVRGRPTNKARIAALTGITRVEVTRLIDETNESNMSKIKPNSMQGVVNLWIRETAYIDARGEPLLIAVEGDSPSFADLVSRCGGDIPYKTLLKELARLEIINVEGDKVQLVRRGYLPRQGEAERLPFLGSDVGALIGTIGHNLTCEPQEQHFQRKVAFDRLTPEGVDALNEFATTKGQQFLEDLDRLLAQHHDPLPPGTEDNGQMIGLGLHVFQVEPKKE